MSNTEQRLSELQDKFPNLHKLLNYVDLVITAHSQENSRQIKKLIKDSLDGEAQEYARMWIALQ